MEELNIVVIFFYIEIGRDVNISTLFTVSKNMHFHPQPPSPTQKKTHKKEQHRDAITLERLQTYWELIIY